MHQFLRFLQQVEPFIRTERTLSCMRSKVCIQQSLFQPDCHKNVSSLCFCSVQVCTYVDFTCNVCDQDVGGADDGVTFWCEAAKRTISQHQQFQLLNLRTIRTFSKNLPDNKNHTKTPNVRVSQTST